LKSSIEKRLAKRQVHLDEIELDEGLDVDGVVEYLKLVADRVSSRGNERAANGIREIAVNTQSVCIVHQYTRGRPIDLAILSDLLLSETKSLKQFSSPQLIGQDKIYLKVIQEGLAEMLQDYQHLSDADSLRYLGSARFGITPELLVSLTGRELSECSEILSRLRQLLVVKVQGERVFLHDELYDLLQEHWLNQNSITNHKIKNQLKQVAAQQLEYETGKYAAATRHLISTLEGQGPKQTLADVYYQAGDEPEEKLRYSDALIEHLHYNLFFAPFLALNTVYFKLSAFDDEELGVQVVSELLRVTSSILALNQFDDEQKVRWQEQVDQEVFFHWLRRFYTRREWPRMRQFADEMRTQRPQWLENPLFRAEFEGWMTLAQVEEGRALEKCLGEFQRILDSLVGTESKYQKEPDPDALYNRWQNVYGLLCNHLGYTYRHLGNYTQAEHWYQEAIRRFRATEWEVWLANTLNNYAFVLAEQGQLREARRLCEDAINLRWRHGELTDVGLSHNVLARAHNLALDPIEAVENALAALNIFRFMANVRGIGLASIYLGEGLRRRMIISHPTASEGEIGEDFADAERHLQQAIDIFEKDVPEKLRQVEALIELGCVYRDWGRWLPKEHPEREKKFLQAEKRLQQAEELAKDEFLLHRIDATVNRAWNYYYWGQLDSATKVLEGLKDERKQKNEFTRYFIEFRKGLPLSEQNGVKGYLLQLAKIHSLMLLATKQRHEGYRQGKRRGNSDGDEENLIFELAKQCQFAFTYAYAANHPHLETVKDHIYGLLATWGVERRNTFLEGLRRCRRDYALSIDESSKILDVFLSMELQLDH
jgi:tetratricopeptide (TPR) repeat protein